MLRAVMLSVLVVMSLGMKSIANDQINASASFQRIGEANPGELPPPVLVAIGEANPGELPPPVLVAIGEANPGELPPPVMVAIGEANPGELPPPAHMEVVIA